MSRASLTCGTRSARVATYRGRSAFWPRRSTGSGSRSLQPHKTRKRQAFLPNDPGFRSMEITPIRRLAIVNRGEAAMRCVRTVKSLRALEGTELSVIALYTDVDREAPFVRHADLAVRLPVKTTPVAAYLD